MARHRRTDLGQIPERLARYVASEWPGGIGEWEAAALAWLREDDGRSLPFGEFGDSIDVLKMVYRLKMGLAAELG
jgi:hypothetical protein